MGVYYYVACHTCKEKAMLPKCPVETAEEVHKEWAEKYHKDHITQMSNDYDEDFMDLLWNEKYRNLGMESMEEFWE